MQTNVQTVVTANAIIPRPRPLAKSYSYCGFVVIESDYERMSFRVKNNDDRSEWFDIDETLSLASALKQLLERHAPFSVQVSDVKSHTQTPRHLTRLKGCRAEHTFSVGLRSSVPLGEQGFLIPVASVSH